MDLQTFFNENQEVALGFSGGVDSSYLLYAAKQWAQRVGAYYIKTSFQPEFEFTDARRLAEELGVELRVIRADILLNEAVARNPADRCYHCKTALFSLLGTEAARDGFPLLIDGTNASDDAGDRPGMRALRELSVRSPLRECGITKAEVRRLSREAGLFTWDKPAYACLATRIPTGQAITAELLEKVEGAEDRLFSLGFTDFRVRILGDGARLQLPENQLEQALRQREEICRRLEPYFKTVMLDLSACR